MTTIKSDWDFSISDLKTDRSRHTPKISKDRAELFLYYLKGHFIPMILHERDQRIYRQSMQLGRVVTIKRSIRNIHHWIQQMTLTLGNQLSLNLIKTGKDLYGNLSNNYTLDFYNYEFSSYTHFSGRAYVQLCAELHSYMVISRLKRWLSMRFPRLFDPLKNRYKTCFDVVIKFWIDQWHYYEITCYQIKVTDNIVVPYSESEYAKRRNETNRRTAFASRKSLSGL